jgi:hypothetical protein
MISFLCGDPVISKINVRGYISGTILGDSRHQVRSKSKDGKVKLFKKVWEEESKMPST